MTYSVYAIREKGTNDVRYIGQTFYSGAKRLREFLWLARTGHGDAQMTAWLRSINFNAEAITIATAETRGQALLVEKQAIQLFHAAGFPLLNHDHVPSIRNAA